MLIWHIFIARSAFSWLSGETPAQQLASTVILTSGKNALISNAFEDVYKRQEYDTSLNGKTYPVSSLPCGCQPLEPLYNHLPQPQQLRWPNSATGDVYKRQFIYSAH